MKTPLDDRVKWKWFYFLPIKRLSELLTGSLADTTDTIEFQEIERENKTVTEKRR